MLSTVDWVVKAKFCSMLYQTQSLARELRDRLVTTRLGREASVLDSIASTQDEARRLAAGGAAEGSLVWALEQTHGRGRMDRAWSSPRGSGLWFSLVLRPELPADVMPWLTLAAGVGVATALRRLAGVDIRLKWPNDLLLGRAKLGGILAEAESAEGRIAFVVLGVGVNLRRPPGGFDPAVDPPPAALQDGGELPGSPAAVLAAVLAELESAYDALAAGGAGDIRRRWLDLSDTVGRHVSAQVAGDSIEGLAVDIAADGALLIERADGSRVPVSSGEVIHLR